MNDTEFKSAWLENFPLLTSWILIMNLLLHLSQQEIRRVLALVSVLPKVV